MSVAVFTAVDTAAFTPNVENIHAFTAIITVSDVNAIGTNDYFTDVFAVAIFTYIDYISSIFCCCY